MTMPSAVDTASRPASDAETPVRVVDRRPVAADVVELTLTRPDGGPLPAWAPGAHIDLILGNGLVRQYSLAGDPADPSSWRLGVLREPAGRGGSEFIHTALEPGTELLTRGPRNHFELAPAQRYLFIAGGIGITPLLPMIADVAARGREWSLLYGGRSRRSMAFCEELAGYGTRVQLCPQDEFGLLDLASALGEPTSGTAIYCCGPEALISAVEERSARWPGGALHVERFSPRTEPAGSVAPGAIQVKLARSGLTLEVPADESILDVVTAAGVPVLSSCEDGVCGTCETPVLDGVPDHHDSVLSAEEQECGRTMILCVSRALSSRLVLDL